MSFRRFVPLIKLCCKRLWSQDCCQKPWTFVHRFHLEQVPKLNGKNITTIYPYSVRFAWSTELLQSFPIMHNNQRNNLYHHIYSLFNYFAIVEFWVVHGYYKIAVLARKWFIFFHCMYSLLQMSFDQAVYWKRKNWFLPSI